MQGDGVYKMETISSAKDIFTSSLRFFRVHPISLLPMLVCWSGYAAVILYVNYGYDWNSKTTTEAVIFAICCFLAYAIMFGVSNLILLEMIQQVESGKSISLGKAVIDAIFKDLWKALPLLLVWGIIWFVLAFISALLSRKGGGDDREVENFSAKNAVGTLLGDKGGFRLSSAFFDALSKGIRMVVFLMLPAIAWEGYSPLKSFKKGLKILGDIKVHFIVAYGATAIFAALVLLAPAIIYMIDGKFDLQLPQPFWVAVLIYMAIASSLSLIVEQIYVAELYMWHFDWERINEERISLGKLPIPFGNTAKPSFFDKENTLRRDS